MPAEFWAALAALGAFGASLVMKQIVELLRRRNGNGHASKPFEEVMRERMHAIAGGVQSLLLRDELSQHSREEMLRKLDRIIEILARRHRDDDA